MMILPGKLPRFFAIIMSGFELPLIAGKETILTEGPLAWQTVSIPALDQLYGYIFFLMWTFIAYANFLDTMERDIRGRKRKKPNQ